MRAAEAVCTRGGAAAALLGLFTGGIADVSRDLIEPDRLRKQSHQDEDREDAEHGRRKLARPGYGLHGAERSSDTSQMKALGSWLVMLVMALGGASVVGAARHAETAHNQGETG